MGRLYLVRHGRALAGYGEAVDPGLDDVGLIQAEAVVKKLGGLTRMPILTSPLLRAQETAVPLARHWRITPAVEEAFSEILAPAGGLAERGLWLKEFMTRSWKDATADLGRWRARVISALLRQRDDTVIVSHFMAINAALGVAVGDDRTVVFMPDNGSITVLDAADGELTLVDRGREASTRVL